MNASAIQKTCNSIISHSECTSSGASIAYTYTDDRLTFVSVNDTTEYTLTYDEFGRSLATIAGSASRGTSTTLSTNAYDEYGKLDRTTYGNGFVVSYVYDSLDRVIAVKFNDTVAYRYTYNGEGDLYSAQDVALGYTIYYEYDHAGRCMASTEQTFTVSNGEVSYGTTVAGYGYEYDLNNNLSKLTCTTNGTTWATTYTYDGDNRPTATTLSNGKTVTNTYDALGRLTRKRIGLSSNYDTTYTYLAGANNSQTALLASYQNGSDTAYTYTYDDNGNITRIQQGTLSASYTYDAANQLIREDNGFINQTVTYTYDAWGNILTKSEYPYTTGTLGTPSNSVNYTYTNSAWGDQLTSYDGETISYNAMGNPVSYRGYTTSFEGKQLVSAVKSGKNITFAYDENGLRTQKTVNNVTTNYYYNGSVLMSMTKGDTSLLFSYDAAGNVVAVEVQSDSWLIDGETLYYIRNGQGDITGLINSSGRAVIEYRYDTWGRDCSLLPDYQEYLELQELNPFRYRGYVYDTETGWYYLQSRYYDPEVGRFINADVYLSTGQGVLGHNCYAYCSDNPIIRIDISGKIDYIYKLDGTYTVEDNRNSFEKFFGIQTPDKYYIEVDGIRYLANSKETVTLYAFDNIELDFLDTKFDELISEAEEEAVTFERIMAESIGGNLDFKLQLDDSTLYYADGIVYNKNEMGNFMWSYLLKKNGYERLISGSLAQGGSLFGKQHRFDESHDVKARKAGIAYYKKQKKAGLIK